MSWRRAIKWWVAAFGMTVVIGIAWDYLEAKEVELTLGSFRREEAQPSDQMLEVKHKDFGPCEFTVNERMEVAALEMLMRERVRGGISRLTADADLTLTARNHARDMVTREYFSHADPNGGDAGDRLAIDGIPYAVVGENLAFADSVGAAHGGLMASRTHRSNILEARFGRVGVGVLDGGACGVVVVQNFAD